VNIALLGDTAGTYTLAQRLLDDNASRVFHYGASVKVPSTNRYHPLFSLDRNLDKFILDIPVGKTIDLMFPLSLNYQLWPKFRQTMLNYGIPLLMPDANVAMLEWSKVIGKKFLEEAGVPTTEYSVYKKQELIDNFFKIKRPFVLKFDQDWRAGLQTVIINDDNVDEEYNQLTSPDLKRFYEARLGDWIDQEFVVEQYIEIDREISYHVLCNDVSWAYIGSARDYKKRYEGDIGFNTAGMGSYSPVDEFPNDVHLYADKIIKLIWKKGYSMKGILYLGIAITKTGKPLVLEINTRPGDPEIQSILPLIENNLPNLLYDAAMNKKLPTVTFNDMHTVSLRVISSNYNLGSAKFDERERPQLWPLVGGIKMGMTHPNDLLFSVLTVTDATRIGASDRLYKFLKNKFMGDYTFRADIGYLK
jgi:phosphoribosylamine-glycine ligase